MNDFRLYSEYLSRAWSLGIISALFLFFATFPGSAICDEEAVADKFNRLVREYRFSEAQAVLDEAVVKYPANPIFPMQLVSFRATQRAYVDLQQNIVEENSTDNPGRALRAAQRILAVQPDHVQAGKAIALLSDEVSRRTEPLLSKCQDELSRGDTDAARETVTVLLSLNPADPRIRGLLSRIDEKIDDNVRAQEEEVRKTLSKIEILAKGQHGTAEKKKEALRLQQTVVRSLADKPGDQNMIALARRAQSVLSQGQSKDEKAASAALAAAVVTHEETPEQKMDRGKRLLSEGRFSEAEEIFSGLVRSGNFARIAHSYIYQGIARLAQVRTSDVVGARQQLMKARTSFVNALRFDANAAIPPEYEKYSRDFSEARHFL